MKIGWGPVQEPIHAPRGAAGLALCVLMSGYPCAASAQVARPLSPPTREEVTRQTTPPTATAKQTGGRRRDRARALRTRRSGIPLDPLRVARRRVRGTSRARRCRPDVGYSSYVGQDVPISTVCEIRDRAATILRDAGYIAAVQVPEQRIEGGTVHFQVLMARLTQVRVRGDATGAESARRLSRPAHQAPLFNRNEAERYLLLASDMPGLYGAADLRPAGTVPGDVIGDVTVQRMPAYVDFNVQNGGSRRSGRWGGLLRAQLFGLTGLGDRTTLAVFTTPNFKSSKQSSSAHDMRLGPRRHEPRRQLHLCLGAAVHARHRRSRPDAAGHGGARLSVRPPPGDDAPRLGRHGLRQPGRRARQHRR